MKGREALTLASVLLVVGILVAVSPAAAKSTPFDFWEVSCEVRPGIAWISPDGVLHVRGRVSEAVFYVEDPAGGAIEAGTNTVVGHADLDSATGDGEAFGVHTLIYLLAPGSLTGTFDGTWNGSLNLFTGFFSGRGVSDGTGDLRHQKMRNRIEAEPAPAWLANYLAANPPPCGAAAVTIHVTGTVNHPNRP